MNGIAENDCAIELPDHNSSGDKSGGSTIKPVLTGVFRQSKSASQSCLHLINSALLKVSTPLNAGFSLVANAAIDNDPVSDSCIVKTGRNQPNCMRLVNLVKVSHNHFRLSGITPELWSRINPFSALSNIQDTKGYCGAGSNVYLIAP